MPAPNANPSKPSVLLVDDDPSLRRVLVRCLRGRYDCFEAASARDASALVAARDVDAVVLDLTLRDGSGLDWIDEYRAHCPDGVVIVLTGSVSPHDATRALRSGADAVLLKPCPPSDLTNELEQRLALREAARALAAARAC